jgi:CheY-like chemotaxis protein
MSNSNTVLIVDDQAATRTIIRTFLEKSGYTILEACNGLECLKILHEQIVGLLILDLIMPEMDGLETMKQIHNAFHEKAIPVIVVTGFANKEADPRHCRHRIREQGSHFKNA